MKKIEKTIKNGERKLKKLSKAAYYDNNLLKTLASELDAIINQSKNELIEISDLKKTLELKKKKSGDKKNEIKTLGKELKKSSITIFKEFLKRQKEERRLLKAQEKQVKETIKELVEKPIKEAVKKPIKEVPAKPIKKVVKPVNKPTVKKTIKG